MAEIRKVVFVVSELTALALNIQKSLDKEEYFIETYADPMLAIKKSIQEPPFAVISDFQFNALMGLEVIQQIKIKYPDIKSVLLVNSESHPDVKTARDLGSFIMTKPVDIPKLEQYLKTRPTAKSVPAIGGRNIMIVEKSSNIRFNIRKCFGDIKAEITEATNPFELIEKFYTKKWDLIFFNIDNDFMPVDEFLKTVADRKWQPTSFVLLSTSWDGQKMSRFIARGFPHFLPIPIKEEEVKKLVNIILLNA